MVSYKKGKINGLTWVYSESDTELCTVSLWIRAGAVDENKTNAGISHLLEHMIFRGSTDKDSDSNEKIFEAFDLIGANHNGETEKDYTLYYATGLVEHLKEMLRIICAFVLRPKLDADVLEKEKDVVAQELRKDNDNPNSVGKDLVSETLFEGCVLENNVGGTERTVQSIQYDELVDYYNKRYVADNMVVSICGGKLKDVKRMIEKEFGKWTKYHRKTEDDEDEDKDKKKKLKYHCKLNGKTYVKTIKENNENQVIIFVAFAWDPKEVVIGKILQTIIAGLTSSRLFLRLRTEKGLVYGVRAKVERFQSGGMVLINTGTKAKDIDKVCKLIDIELNKLCAGEIDKEELEKVKRKIINAAKVKIINSTAKSFYYGRETLYWGDVCSYEDFLKEVEKIKLEKVKKGIAVLSERKKVRIIVK